MVSPELYRIYNEVEVETKRIYYGAETKTRDSHPSDKHIPLCASLDFSVSELVDVSYLKVPIFSVFGQ